MSIVAPAPYVGFWNSFIRKVTELIARRAHVNVVIVIKGGSIELIRYDESVKPQDLLGH